MPGAIAATRDLADRLTYTMADLGYRFPDYPVPPGETMASFLRKIAQAGARERYRPYDDRARRQVERELDLIEKLDLAGYFLIVWDIVNYCRQEDILVQGRGSAANSAVCYSLGITAVDPVGMDLLFERFLSEERGEWPDIDLDLPSGDRRERAIQHLYAKYGNRVMPESRRNRPDRAAHRDDGQRHHLSRPQRRAGSRESPVARTGPDRPARQGDESFRVGRSERNTRAQPPRGRPRFPPSRDSDVRPIVGRDPGSAAPSRPALRRHGDVPRPPGRRGAARERQHARPRRRPVGQGRLRRHEDREGGSAGTRHDVGAAGCTGVGE